MALSPLWQSLVISQAIVWLPLAAGHQMHRRGMVPEQLSAQLHRFTLYVMGPLIGGLAIWRLEWGVAGWHWAPLAMLILMVAATVGGWFLAQRLAEERRRIGTLALMIPISNTGFTMAGFMTLLLVGERGFAYNALIVPPYAIFVYLVWFPIGEYWSEGRTRRLARMAWVRMLAINLLPLLGLAAGAELAWRGVPMGEGWVTSMRWLAYIGTAIVMFAIGAKIRLRRLGGPLRPLMLWTYGVKFVVSPAIVLGICLAAGLSGDLAAALLLAAAAPVGVNVPAISTIHNLDIDLANAGYIWSTLVFMVVVVPLIVLALHLPFFR